MGETDYSGKLEDTALPDLLCKICGDHETGVLRLARHGISKAIYIDRGRIVFASSTEKDDRLGELLLRRGLLRVQQLENALAFLPSQRRLGNILVEMGYIRAEDLVWGVITQVKEIVFGLFQWFDGEYRFERGDLPSKEVITLNLSTPEVILSGISLIDRWWRVLPGLGNLDVVYRTSAARDAILRQLKLNQKQSALLHVLEQPTTVRDLCGFGILPDFETCRTLWAFRVIGLAEPTSEPPRRPGFSTILQYAPGPAQEAAGVTELLDSIRASDAQPLETAAQLPVPEQAPELTPGAVERAAAQPIAAEPAASGEPPEEEVQVLRNTAGTGPEPGKTEEAEAPPQSPAPPPLPEMPSDPPQAGAGVEAIPVTADAGPEGEPVPDAGPENGAEPGASAAGSGAAPSRPPPTLDGTIVEAGLDTFNERHRRLQAMLTEKMGDKAAGLIGRSLRGMARELPGLFSGVTAAPDGTLAPELLKENILKTGQVDFAMALELLIERELEAVAGLLGPAARRELAAGLKAVSA
ncbi:MAG: DUF4388 domain-containing protein [Acidobacteriota bacterium]